MSDAQRKVDPEAVKRIVEGFKNATGDLRWFLDETARRYPPGSVFTGLANTEDWCGDERVHPEDGAMHCAKAKGHDGPHDNGWGRRWLNRAMLENDPVWAAFVRASPRLGLMTDEEIEAGVAKIKEGREFTTDFAEVLDRCPDAPPIDEIRRKLGGDH